MSTVQTNKSLVVFLIAAFCLFVVVISAAAYGFYQTEKWRLLGEATETIQSVANLKVAQIEQWRQERLADAQVIADSPLLVENFKHLLKFPEEMACRAGFLKWLQTIKNLYRYDNILLLNSRGEILLKAAEDQKELWPGSKKLIAEVLARPRVLFSDFYRNPGDQEIRLSLLAPIVEDRDGQTVVLGLLFLRLNAGDFLFPLIQSWPTASASAETLLVRREGDEVLYLNELRHRQGTALALHFPLKNPDLPAAQAVLGREGVVWGKDYRGIPVLAVIRRIAHSPWILVSKVDEKEVYSELQNYARLFGALGLGLSLTFGLLCIMLWRRQETIYLRGLAQQEAEQKQQLEDILSATPDQIYLMDREGRCLFANRAAVQALGLDYPELVGHNLRNRGLPPTVGELLTSTVGLVSTSGEIRSGEVCFALAGENRWFDYILKPLSAGVDTHPAVLASFRDITDRREAEDKLAYLNHLYAALSRAGDVMLKERQPHKLQEEFCRIAVEEGGLRFAWVGWREPESDTIASVASWGAEEGYLQAIPLSMAVAPDNPCPTGTAIREGRIGLYQDLENSDLPPLWQSAAVARGYRSLGVFPLRLGERLVGAVNFYSALPHFFTPDKVQLLERLTSQLGLALDMTIKEEERQNAEKELRQTKEFLDSILQHAPLPMYVTDRQGRYLLVNPAWETISRKKREEALGHTAAELFLPNTAQSFMESDQQVLQKKKPIRYEDLISIQGTQYFFQTIKFPLHNDQGEVEAVGGISIDLTEWRQVEEALRLSEERYRGIFHNAPVGIFQSTLEGRYVNLNPAMAKILGYASPQEVLEEIRNVGQDIYVHPEERADILRRLQAGEAVVKSENLFHRRDGEVRTANTYFRVLRGQDQPVHLEGFVEDITERKKAEENLLLEKQFADTAIDSLPGLFYLFDDQGTMLRWNQNFEKVSGYTADEISGMKPQDFFRGQAKLEIQKAIEVAQVRGEHSIQAELVTRDGHHIPHFFTARRILLKGKPCLVGTGIDITELRQAEEALRESEEQYRLLVKTIPAVVARGYRDWSVDVFDEKIEALTGYPLEAFNGRQLKWRDLILEEDLPEAEAIFRKAYNTHTPYVREYRIRTRSGDIRWLQERSQMIFDDQGAFRYVSGVLFDITERQQAEEALRTSEQRYRTLVENINLGISLQDPDHRIIMANAAMGHMFHKDPQELVGKHCFREYEKREAACPHCPGRKAQATGLPTGAETEGVRDDGSRFSVHVHAVPLYTPDGKPAGFIEVVEDITERKRAADALWESREILQAVLDNIPARIFWKDRNLRYIGCNPLFARDAGFEKPEELVGKNDFDMGWRDQAELYRRDDRAVIDRGESKLFFEESQTSPTGQKINLLTSKVPLRNAKGSIVGVLGTYIDITERKQAQEAVRESEESLRQILEVLPIGVFVTDQHGVILQANPAGRSIWGGVQYVGIAGYGAYKGWWRSTGEPIKPEDWALARAIRKGETSLNEVIDIETFTGDRKIILSSALPVKNVQGEVIKAIAVNQDITERIAFEEKLKASLQEKEVLLKEIHHRVKNNMQIISSLLRLQSDKVKLPEVQEVFQESQNRIRSMALVHEMLYQSPDLASISFGAYLKDLVNGLFRSFRADTHQIALTFEVEDISLPVDLALACGLMINELVSNTLKHAFPDHRRGELRISARQVSPEELLITIRDTGVGLPAGLDFRNTSSLGLRLVTLLAGQIHGSVELDRNDGTAFLVTLPLKENHG